MINDRKLAEKAQQLEAENTSYALATVVACKSPTSARPGFKALITAAGEIHGWIGGGCTQPAVIKTVRQSLRDGLPQLIRVSPVEDRHPDDDVTDFKSACHSGGSVDIFIEPVLARPELLVMGSSVVAQSLAALAQIAGFAVTVASPSAEEAAFPGVEKIIQGFDLSGLELSSAPQVVVATQGKGDEAALKAALAIDATYRAFVASEPKAKKLKQVLRDKGNDADSVEAIIAPAGIAIGAESPQEIAVSVLAGLIAARRGHPASVSVPAQESYRAGGADSSASVRTPQVSAQEQAPVESSCCSSASTE